MFLLFGCNILKNNLVIINDKGQNPVKNYISSVSGVYLRPWTVQAYHCEQF